MESFSSRKMMASAVALAVAITLHGCGGGGSPPAPPPPPGGKLHLPLREIAPGVNMPVISIGVGGLESKEAATIVANWMKLGGRGVDTAFVYKDQEVVAKAIKDAGMDRKDVFITSKIPGCFNASFFVEQDLKQLGTDYIDLLLIHSPVCNDDFQNCSALKWDCSATWVALESYLAVGKLKSIGVSNFKREHLEPLLAFAHVVPAVNQVQLNVLEHDDDTIAFSKAHNIIIEAYSPLGRGNHSGDIAGNKQIQHIASVYNVSTYQIAMRWLFQHGHIITFQSTSQAHQLADADIFGFNLTAGEMQMLDDLRDHPAAYIM
eukprot:TRINITY_DN90046_c0_g1_i1.p1 TRINITY_DN90046_c0_g1~~TRINITY_DN90046_c0_g1_i1.p1  ORF type:complete len:319 (+),score=63.69 TRINITY_DN90046_c0_g1_i1:87-1043(+)